MFNRFTVAVVLLLSWTAAATAQTDGTQADHEALRALKDKAIAAVNARDYNAVQILLHDPFMATAITQDSFTDFDKMKAYFEDLFTRDFLRIKNVSFSAEADDLSTIFTGTIALTKGTDVESYEMADGRTFDINGRWTAVSIKDGSEWKLAAIHMGTNFLDNPVLNAIERSIIWTALGAAVIGLLIGLAGGWFIGGRRARRALA